MTKRSPVVHFPRPVRSPAQAPPSSSPSISPTSRITATQKAVVDGPVCFHRKELNLILSRYGAMVAAGHWRDYAIDMGRDCAVFSIFRHTSERPLYRLEKHPKLAAKQGAYLVRNERGMVLKRGRDLAQVLKVFEKKLELVQV